jgi:hypothetical protein
MFQNGSRKEETPKNLVNGLSIILTLEYIHEAQMALTILSSNLERLP